MNNITNIQEVDLVVLAEKPEPTGTPLRVGSTALVTFDEQISLQLEQLEAQFAKFVTNDSLGNSLKRNR
jgi:hypothetical protein